MRAKSKHFLLLSLIGLMLTSWLLFFRDDRLILNLSNSYPQLSFLVTTRLFLISHGLNTIPTFLFGLFSVTAFISYFFLLCDQPRSIDQTLIRAVSSKIRHWSFLFALVIFLSFPALSTDIFSYMASDRVLSTYSQNPWLVSPDHFPADPFVQIADWTDTTRVYGFINQFIYTPPSFLAGNNFFLALFLYKLVALAGFVALAFFLTSRSFFSSHSRAPFISAALLFNPLLLLELVGNAHNDIFMILFAVISIYFFTHHKFFLSALFAVLSVQVKLMLLVWVGLALIQLLSQKKFRPLAIFSTTFLFGNALCFFLMHTSPLIFLERVLFNSTVLWQSLAQILSQYFSVNWGTIGLIIIIGLILFCIATVFARQHTSVSTSALFFLIYLLFFMSAYWNWYCLWLVMFLPYVANKKLLATWQVWTFTSLLAYPLLWFSYRFWRAGYFWHLFQYLCLVLPVLFVLSYDKIRRYGSKKIRSSVS